MSLHNDCIRLPTVALATGFVLALASVAISSEPLSDPTGLVDAYSLDATSQAAQSARSGIGVRPIRSGWLDSLNPAKWKHELTGVHRATHVVAGVVTSICLLATAAALLLLLKKSYSPTIASLLRRLCILMVVNGAACLFHFLTLWWPANYLDATLRGIAAVVSVVIVGTLLWSLPRAISFHGRESLKTAENELRQSKERFERALRGSSNGLWEWNIEAGEVWYAPRFRELLGYSDDEFPNELASWESRLHPDDKTETLLALENHLKKDEVFDVEYRLLTKAGDYRWFHARGVAIRNPNGQPYLMAGSIQDIDARKLAQDALRERDEQLRHAQKLEAVGTLAGGIAHEFNNLIQAIQGYTIYATEGLDPAEQRYEDLNQVLIASKRAASLTKQLLGFSRRQVLKLEPVHLNSLMEDLVKLIRPLIGENITIELDLDPKANTIQADAGHIQQLIMNLCINARDAMSSGGKLRIQSHPQEITSANSKQFANLAAGRYVAILVSDNGCGIPRELRDHVFEPFFTTKGVGKGTGLGLAMAYGIVQQHHGLIQLESELNEGTKFTIYLPAIDGMAGESPNEPTKSECGGSETILVAEDDSLVRTLAVRTLRQAGYQTLIATDGTEAADLFDANSERISLVMLDVMMPNLNGHDALKRIRAIRPDVPALMCTGYDPETMNLDADADIDIPLLQKPFEPDVLLEAVRDVLDREICLAN
jgi:PAS domain S-box-containing protein